MMRLYDRIAKSMHTLKYFTQNDWVWTNANVEALMASIPESDKKVSWSHGCHMVVTWLSHDSHIAGCFCKLCFLWIYDHLIILYFIIAGINKGHVMITFSQHWLTSNLSRFLYHISLKFDDPFRFNYGEINDKTSKMHYSLGRADVILRR